jgi:acetyl esterase/lipase
MPETPVWIPPKHGPVPNPVMTGSGLRRYDISYALIPGFRPLELQLFVPESEQPTPLIVYIHGGGYAGGTRVEGTPWFELTNYRQKALARGFAFASIDYRLGFEQSFPAAVNDAHASLRWLAKFADKLNIDISRVVVWGESAGGHLAALTVNTFGDDFFEGTNGAEKSDTLNIVGLIDWYGAADLTSIVRPMDGTDESMPEAMRFPPEYFNLGSDRWKDTAWLKKASPVTYITSKSVDTLIVHGDSDTMVPLQQSHVLAHKLHAEGVKHKLVEIPNGEHGFMGLPQEQIDAILDLTLDFAQKVCGK